jgi:3-hydroxybutyryl-CoA dehydratase
MHPVQTGPAPGLNIIPMKEGTVFEIGYQVTEEVYNGFIALFRDANPLHTSNEFAKEKKFAGKVMHGAILAGFLSNFIGEQLPQKNVIVQSYKMNFMKPVYLGDHLKLKAFVDGVFESVNCIIFKYSFINSNEVTVCKGEVSIGII